MLILNLTKKSKLIDFHIMRNNITSETYCIECILESFENEGYIKPIVVLWECYVVFSIFLYLKKFHVLGGIAKSNQPELSVFSKIGNNVNALAAIIAIAQCQIKNTRSDRFIP